MTDPSPDPGPHGEAVRWFVLLLEPDCPESERIAFERWRAASPAHAAAFREIQLLWKQSEAAAEHPAVRMAARRALQQAPLAPRPLWRWSIPFALSALAVAVALVVMPHGLAPPADPVGTHYVTVAGERRTVHLTDNSTIVLDTHTEVVERYSAHVRRIDLLHGQAEFQVQGNPAWPFVVHAQGGTVTAVGTRFQLRLRDDATAVVLLKGKLAIATKPAHGVPQFAALAAGQQLSFDQAGRIDPVQPADVELAEGWTEGKLIAHDWLLPDLIDEMNRYSAEQLKIGDASLRKIRVSGVFHTGDEQTLIQVLQQGWPIRASRVSPGSVVLLQRE